MPKVFLFSIFPLYQTSFTLHVGGRDISKYCSSPIMYEDHFGQKIIMIQLHMHSVLPGHTFDCSKNAEVFGGMLIGRGQDGDIRSVW